MLIFSVLLFAVATFFLSFLVVRGEDLDKGRVAASASLIAWGSLMYGFYLAKVCL
jgi:hypothetical protein